MVTAGHGAVREPETVNTVTGYWASGRVHGFRACLFGHPGMTKIGAQISGPVATRDTEAVRDRQQAKGRRGTSTCAISAEFWIVVQRRHAQDHMRLRRALGHQVRAASGAEAAQLPWRGLVRKQIFFT
jgi:hypothetical protein